MIRHFSILLGLACLAASTLAEARPVDPPLYSHSVLYRGEQTCPGAAAKGDASNATALDFATSDSLGVGTQAASSPESLSTSHLALADSARAKSPSSFGASFVGAFLGTAALGLAGGAIGASSHEDSGGEEDWEEAGAAVAGVYGGVIVGSATGAHLANARRGYFGTDLVVAAGAGLISLPFIALGPVGWFAGSVIQSSLVALSENSSAKRHARETAARRSAQH
jgi:hypothetical protein